MAQLVKNPPAMWETWVRSLGWEDSPGEGNWRLIALQYCIDFCHTLTWISHGYTYVPSLLTLPPTSHPVPPLCVITEPQIWAPCVTQQTPTGYLFDIWWCICFSAALPVCPILSSIHCVQICSLCLHFHCWPAYGFISTIFLDSIYIVNIQ